MQVWCVMWYEVVWVPANEGVRSLHLEGGARGGSW